MTLSPQTVGVAGAVTLLFGVFAPIVSVPMGGSLNYFQNGRGDGVIVALLGLIALALCLTGRLRWVLPIGTACLVLLTYSFVRIQRGFSGLRADMRRDLADNPFAGLGEAMLGSIQLQWGWVVLFIGVGMLVLAALQRDRNGALADASAVHLRSSRTGFSSRELWAFSGVALFAVVGAAVFGYLREGSDSARRRSNGGSQISSSLAADLKLAKESGSRVEENAYLSRLSVRNVEVGNSVLDERGVFGEVTNTGSRTLKEVEITIYFLDRTGRAIHEKTYHPVLVSEYSFGDSNRPLRPGYSRRFGVRADDAPSSWSGRVSVRVSDVEFAQ